MEYSMASDATAAGMISIAGRAVPRMGFGAMQLRGSNESDAAGAVLRRAVELGVRVIDTAWYYGGDAVNRFIAAALQPYPADRLLPARAGARADYTGSPPKPDYRPKQLRSGNDRDRTVLGLDNVPLTHLRWPGGTDASA